MCSTTADTPASTCRLRAPPAKLQAACSNRDRRERSRRSLHLVRAAVRPARVVDPETEVAGRRRDIEREAGASPSATASADWATSVVAGVVRGQDGRLADLDLGVADGGGAAESTWTIRAMDGTPAESTMKSMYGPGTAVCMFAGTLADSVPAPA